MLTIVKPFVIAPVYQHTKTEIMKSVHLFTAVLSLVILFTACQKNNDNTTRDEKETELTQQSDDQAKFSSDVDLVADDLNGVLESSNALLGRGTNTTATICNATVVIDSISNPRTITITYNGPDCTGLRTRTGTVVASMPSSMRWKDAGATLTVTITNLKITRVADGKFITINGSTTHTNVTGGRLRDLPTQGSIVHTINSNNMTVKFDSSAQQRSWSIAKKRTFSYNNGVVITTTGNHTIGANTNVAEWGTNRFGNTFVTSIEQPLVVTQSCNFRLTAGQVKHELLARNLTVTFGLNAGGAAITCPGNNPYYMKLVWTGPNGQSYTVIRPY